METIIAPTMVQTMTPTKVAPAKKDKRTRLIDAANELFYKQGINITTLANIASLGDVPLGNVYYYFKSKEAIILAVLKHAQLQLQKQFDELNLASDSKSRLISFVKANFADVAAISQHGNKLGCLCQELGKAGGTASETAAAIMQTILDWCTKQFVHLGKGDEASKLLATHLLASLQGTSLLTLTFKDGSVAQRQAAFIINWLEKL